MRTFKEASLDKKFLNGLLMGPNCIKLAEELTENLRLERGMRVLDLGCGMALTSIFLAERFGVTVFAADLWIEPTENFGRIREFGLEDKVFPIHAEAHKLPFAREYFDAVTCIDAYHYFGAEKGYIEKYLAPLLRENGVIAAAIPGLQNEFTEGVPAELVPYLGEDMKCRGENVNFYTSRWWRSLWENSGAVGVIECAPVKSHAEAWRDWLETDNEYAREDACMMKAEAGCYFNTIKLIGRKL